jgi:hypothetical protein
MKIRIELEVDLGDWYINPKNNLERGWLFNDILTKDNLSLHDHEAGDTIGEIKKVINCYEIK